MSSTVTTLTVMLYSNSVILLLLVDLAPLPVILIMIKENTKHDHVNIIQSLIIAVGHCY